MASTPSLVQPRVQVQKKDWEEFKTYINETYPRESFTHEQKDFVFKYLKQDGGKCSDLNALWITCIADQLADFAELLPQSHQSIGEHVERIQAITGKAVLGFYNAQHAIRQMIPSPNRTAEQHRMLEIHANIYSFPMELTVDIGRILRVRNASVTPSSQQSRADDQQLFYQLHKIIQGVTRNDDNASSASVQGSEGGVFEPHSIEDNFVRLCAYKVWTEKYEQENPWSVSHMLGQWLEEAVHLFNKVSYHWPTCQVKRFDESQLAQIRITARGWIKAISHRAPVQERVRKPSSNWLMDLAAYPVMEKRHEWESYYCNMLLHAKNLAKLTKRDRVEVEDDEYFVDEHSSKKQRTNDSQQASDQNVELTLKTLESRLINYIDSQFSNIRKNLVQVDRNDAIRQVEVLREINGHFNPIRNQLVHISSGQMHMSQMVDRLSSK